MIDVIIPTYIPHLKYFEYFCESISSLQCQTYDKFIAHIIYNGPEEYEPLVLEKIKDDSRFKLTNIGTKSSGAIARNYGIQNSSQKYIAQLDIDDLYHKDKLNTQLDFMEANEWCSILSTSSFVIDGKSIVNSCINANQYTTHEQIKNRLPHENIICHGSVMIKRSDIENKKLLYNEQNKPGELWQEYGSSMYEDWDLWLRCLNAGLKFHMIPEKLYFWRRGSSVER